MRSKWTYWDGTILDHFAHVPGPVAQYSAENIIMHHVLQ